MLQVVYLIGVTELHVINVDFGAHISGNSWRSFSDSRKKNHWSKICGFSSSMDISEERHQAAWWKSQECLSLWVPSQFLNSLSPHPQPGGLRCAIACTGQAQMWVRWAATCWQAGKCPAWFRRGLWETSPVSAFTTCGGYCAQKISKSPKLKTVENLNHGLWASSSKLLWSCSLQLPVLLWFASCPRSQTGEQPPASAFAPSEMLLSSQSYMGQILQPTYSPDTLSSLSYADGFDEEPPLLEGKIKTMDNVCGQLVAVTRETAAELPSLAVPLNLHFLIWICCGFIRPYGRYSIYFTTTRWQHNNKFCIHISKYFFHCCVYRGYILEHLLLINTDNNHFCISSNKSSALKILNNLFQWERYWESCFQLQLGDHLTTLTISFFMMIEPSYILVADFVVYKILVLH